MSYVITHLKSNDLAALQDALDDFRNVSGIVQGRVATEETTDEEGNVIPAQPAVGDPSTYYAFVLATFEIEAGSPIELAEPEIVTALCGTA